MSAPEVREVVEFAPDGISVRGFLHMPPRGHVRGGLVLTHGAGANCQSPLLVAMSGAYCESGMAVLRFDLPFRQLRPHGPPLRGSAERDQLGIRRAVDLMRTMVSGPIFAGGHSYGGRQTTLLASQPDLADGLVLFSYPLHPPRQPKQMRTAHFPQLRIPALFVHGTRDSFGSLDEMIEALKLVPVRTRLVPVENAGHELLSRRNQGELPSQVTSAFEEMFGPAASSWRVFDRR